MNTTILALFYTTVQRHLPILDASQFSVFFQVSQMGNRLPGGKPFLGDRELVPGFAVDIPGHAGGNLEGIQRAPFQDTQDFR